MLGLFIVHGEGFFGADPAFLDSLPVQRRTWSRHGGLRRGRSRQGDQVRPADKAEWAFGAGTSLAAMLLTTEAIITELPEPKSAPAGGPDGMEDMY